MSEAPPPYGEPRRATAADTEAIAKTPKPPYYAVIFTSVRTDGDNGYAATAQRMEELAAQQPGYLGLESTRGADGVGITVAYFDSEDSIRAWRENAEHRIAQETGKREWYRAFRVRLAKVERVYGVG